LPTTTRGIRFRSGRKAEHEWKCQRRTHEPNTVGAVLHSWIYGFQAIGNRPEGTIATTSVGPAIAADAAHAVLTGFHYPTHVDLRASVVFADFFAIRRRATLVVLRGKTKTKTEFGRKDWKKGL